MTSINWLERFPIDATNIFNPGFQWGGRSFYFLYKRNANDWLQWIGGSGYYLGRNSYHLDESFAMWFQDDNSYQFIPVGLRNETSTRIQLTTGHYFIWDYGIGRQLRNNGFAPSAENYTNGRFQWFSSLKDYDNTASRVLTDPRPTGDVILTPPPTTPPASSITEDSSRSTTIQSTGISCQDEFIFHFELTDDDFMLMGDNFAMNSKTFSLSRSLYGVVRYVLDMRLLDIEEPNIISNFGLETTIGNQDILHPANTIINDYDDLGGQEVQGKEGLRTLYINSKNVFIEACKYVSWVAGLRQKITLKIDNDDLPELGDVVLLDLDLMTRLNEHFDLINRKGVVDGITYAQDFSYVKILI